MTNYDFATMIFNEYYTPLYQYVEKICSNKSIVADVVQETLLVAFQKADELQTHENLPGWLFLTARYKMLQLLEKRLNYDHLDNINNLSDGRNYEDECIAAVELYPIMSKYVTPEELNLILQRYNDGRSFCDLAEEYHTTVPSVKMRISRAKKKLKDILREKYINS